MGIGRLSDEPALIAAHPRPDGHFGALGLLFLFAVFDQDICEMAIFVGNTKIPMKHFLVFIAFIFNGLSLIAQPDWTALSYTQHKQRLADTAVVVSAHPIASEVGKAILQQGGNAIDAMVAVHFALAVVFPRAGNIGGGGFLVYRDSAGTAYTLDFREKAPGAAHRDMYLDSLGNIIPNLSCYGHLASGVPGSVEGMWQAHQRFGQLPWAQLVEPAVQLAEKGVLLTASEAASFNEHRDDFKKYNTYTPAIVKETNWKKGDLFVQTELAATFRRIRDLGRAGFYEGETAELLVAEMRSRNGIIDLTDMRDYNAQWRDPLRFDYKGYQIISMPPPSSGGVALAELFHCIENQDIAKMGFHSVEAMHLMAEAERRAYADRAEHLGDPDFYTVPTKGLLSRRYAQLRMQDFSPLRATPSDSIRAGKVQDYESEETTHYSIVDAAGNAVSVTTTINTSYGSYVVVKGAGFVLNNEMDDFSAKAGAPNLFGLLGADANAIAPHKRMLSSMTPTIVEKDGKLLLVVGTPGGATIITSVFQVILNVIEFQLPLQEAVHSGRFHHQWKPDKLYYERNRFSKSVIQRLQAMGHHPEVRGAIGRVEAILRLPDGRWEGVADNRGDDSAAGY